MAKYKDFDAFYKEVKDELLIFKLFDKKYTMPSSMPAALMLEILRNNKEDDIKPEIVIKVMEALLGKDQLEDLCSKGFTQKQMEDLIKWASGEYGQTKGAEGTEGTQDVFPEKR